MCVHAVVCPPLLLLLLFLILSPMQPLIVCLTVRFAPLLPILVGCFASIAIFLLQFSDEALLQQNATKSNHYYSLIKLQVGGKKKTLKSLKLY